MSGPSTTSGAPKSSGLSLGPLLIQGVQGVASALYVVCVTCVSQVRTWLEAFRGIFVWRGVACRDVACSHR